MKKTVLIVEEDFSTVEVIKTILVIEGFIPVAVTTAADALAFVRHQQPEVILAALCYSDGPHSHLLSVIRAEFTDLVSRTIVMTTKTPSSAEYKTISVMGFRLLTKPFALEALLKLLNEVR